MSKKSIIAGIITTFIAILLISIVFVVTDKGDSEKLSMEQAIEIGSKFLVSTYSLPSVDTFSAELDGDAWKVCNIPGTEIINSDGVLEGFEGGTWYVYVSNDEGQILTFGHTDELQ